MEKVKYYFSSIDAEMAYDLGHHLDTAKSEGVSETELYEAIPDRDPEYFFCRSIGEPGETGDCGKQCGDYEPRNKKFGICKHKGICYTPGDSIIFKIS